MNFGINQKNKIRLTSYFVKNHELNCDEKKVLILKQNGLNFKRKPPE